MKLSLRNILILGVAVPVLGTSAFAAHQNYAQTYTPVTARLLGATDMAMLDTVRATLSKARDEGRKTVRFDISSPGGAVFVALEIAREIRDAHDRDGMTVEVHARTLCASACTFVLASGTPGYRFIHPLTLFLVHPMQGNGGCIEHPAALVTQEEKVITTVYSMVRDLYANMTGQPADVIEDWLICGKERVGRGMMAVDMHIADALDK